MIRGLMVRRQCLPVVLIAQMFLLAQSAFAADKPEAAQALAREGFVVARLVTNAISVNTFFWRFDNLQLTEVNSRKKVMLLPGLDSMPALGPVQSTVTLGKTIPAGRYQITRASVMTGSMSTGVNLTGSLPEFEIAADTLTDLGVLVVQPVGNGDAVLMHIADPGRTQVLLERRFASALSAWLAKPVVGWKPGAWTANRFKYGDTAGGPMGIVGGLIVMKIDSDARRHAERGWDSAKSAEDFLALAKAGTAAMSEPAAAADGSTYFGSALGQILRRGPEGVWTLIDVGRPAEITAMAAIDGLLFAGTEDGELFEVKEGTPRPIGQAPNFGRVVDIRRWKNGTWWLVTRHIEAKTVFTQVFTGPSLSALLPSPVKSMSQGAFPGMWTLRPFIKPVMSNSKYFLGIPGMELQTYDPEADTWLEPRLKKDAPPQLNANHDGSVLYSVRPPQLSTNEAVTWTAMKPGGALLGLALFDSMNGLGLFATDQLTWSGTQEVRKTADGGQTWTKVNELPKSPCDVRTLREIYAQRRMVCVFRDGNIYSTGMDGGWSVERASYF